MIIFRLLRLLRQATIYVDTFLLLYIYIVFRYFYVDPEPTVYEGISFIWGFGGCLGYAKQGYVGVVLDYHFGSQTFLANQKPVVARHRRWHGHATHNTIAGSLEGVQQFSCFWDPYSIQPMRTT